MEFKIGDIIKNGENEGIVFGKDKGHAIPYFCLRKESKNGAITLEYWGKIWYGITEETERITDNLLKIFPKDTPFFWMGRNAELIKRLEDLE